MTSTSAVTREETEKLLYKYRAITSDRIDRVKFRDLLHDTFGMSDDFFMDRGKQDQAAIIINKTIIIIIN